MENIMTELHFSISDYSSSAGSSMLFWAISGCVIIGLAIVKDAVVFLRNRKAEFSCMSFRKKFNTLLRLFLPLAAMFVFFVSFTWPTFRYSRYLSSESIEDTVSNAGTIDRISAVFASPKYHIGDDQTAYLASIVTINGEKYYFLTADGLQIGQQVRINYLPKSHMVLDCVSDGDQDEMLPMPTQPTSVNKTATEEAPAPAPMPAQNHVGDIILVIALVIFIAAGAGYSVVIYKRNKKRWKGS